VIALEELRQLVGPTTLAAERTLPVLPALDDLLPSGALVRGSTVGIRGDGATSLALALAAGPSRAGSWVGFVGWGSVGWAAAAGFGVDLARTAVIPDLAAGDWPALCAAFVDALDVVVVAPTHPVHERSARRLAARGRERGSVFVVVEARFGWPVAPDLVLSVETSEWVGLGRGHGHLRARRSVVRGVGRRGASRGRDLELWLPTSTGEVAVVDPDTAIDTGTVIDPGTVSESARHLHAV